MSAIKIIREGVFPSLKMLARPSTLAQIPRLFHEGFGPAKRLFIQGHNNREMGRLVREQVPVAFVTSWLRSGSTWMCYLLCDILLQNEGVETTTELAFDRKRIVLDQYARLIVKREPIIKDPHYIIKTHDMVQELQAHIGGDPGIRKCKYLYLYRTPEDALVSACHLFRRDKYFRRQADLYKLAFSDIDLFCLSCVPNWNETVTSYLTALDEGVDVHMVAYDQLRRETGPVLTEILTWLGVPHSEATVARAVSNSEFDKLKQAEAKTLKGGIPFFRRGKEGSGKLELKPETLGKIREATQQTFARANECLAHQNMRLRALRETEVMNIPSQPNPPLARQETALAPHVT